MKEALTFNNRLNKLGDEVWELLSAFEANVTGGVAREILSVLKGSMNQRHAATLNDDKKRSPSAKHGAFRITAAEQKRDEVLNLVQLQGVQQALWHHGNLGRRD